MPSPPEGLNPDIVIQAAEIFLNTNPPKTAPPYSTEEYMRHALSACLEALKLGNYGIGAVLVVRQEGQENIFRGFSTVYSDGLYRGHAEFNALEAYYLYSSLPENQRQEYMQTEQLKGNLIIRTAPHAENETIMYASLEPCIMCTAGILNAKINTVVYAHEDRTAGGPAPERLANLPPRWPEIAAQQGLKTYLCDPNSAEDIARTSIETLTLMANLYQVSRPKMRQLLATQGFRAHPKPLN